MSEVFRTLYTILSFTIMLGVIVLVHEFGHYIAARLTGVRVETFSFGFGKRIFGKKVGDTDFRVSLIPMGYPAKTSSAPKRKEVSGFIHHDTF